MSIHRSLVTQGKLTRHRNVLSRTERLQILLEDGRWKSSDAPFNLPKVRSIKHKAKKAPKKEAAAAGAEAGKAAAPAGGAKPAAGKDKAAAPAAAKAPAKK